MSTSFSHGHEKNKRSLAHAPPNSNSRSHISPARSSKLPAPHLSSFPKKSLARPQNTLAFAVAANTRVYIYVNSSLIAKMKFIAAAALAVAGLAAAQNPSDYFPSCGVPCLTDAVKAVTTCDVNNGKCICERETYVKVADAATTCVIDKCGITVAIGMFFPVPFPLLHSD